MSIIGGKQYDSDTARSLLDGLKETVGTTLKKDRLAAGTVITAAARLSDTISVDTTYGLFAALGISRQSAETMISEAKRFLSRDYLETKLCRELGEDPFGERTIEDGIAEKTLPLGVLTHIAAGNAAGLPAYSVIEGLLAGNINILKLPGSDEGLSSALLSMLIEIEPGLADYIYVFDLPSVDAKSIKKMLEVSDAAAVWGSDFAVSGIRALSPPGLRIIEWGHKLSFACVTKKGETRRALDGIAKDICETEQLLCSSPQCVYYEADSFDELKAFGARLFKSLEAANGRIAPVRPDPGAQAEITSLLRLTFLEELTGNKSVLTGDGFSVTADEDASLCPSPMYRNIWVKPMRTMFETLREKKGYLQTAALACSQDELTPLTELLITCGVCRITPCGGMTASYAGEPHDGRHALRQYVKTAVYRR